MSINIGSGDVYDVMVGSDEAQAVYLGATKVWPFTPFTETNTARSNQPVPANATGVYITLIGGGGGGGGAAGGAFMSAGGGGGGGGAAVVERSYISASNLGTTYSVSVGSGGGNATSGTASSFSSGSVSVIAGGGGGGGTGASGSGGSGGSGGAASVSGVTGISTVNGTAGASSNATTNGAAASNNTSGGAPGGGAGAGRTGGGGGFSGGKGGNSQYAAGGGGGAGNAWGKGTAGTAGSSASSGYPGGGGGGGGSSGFGQSGANGAAGGTSGAGGGGAGGGDAANSTGGGAGAAGYTKIEWVGQSHPAIKPGPAPVVPVFDAVGSGGTQTSLGASSLATSGTHTCSGNAVIVAISVTSLSSVSGATITYGGQSMTQLGVANMNNNAALPMALYGLLNPPTGLQTISVSVTGVYLATVSMTSASYSGVSSLGGVTTNYGSSAAPSQSVSSSSSALVVQAFGSGISAASYSGYNQSKRAENDGTYANVMQGDATGAASVTFSATLSASNNWASMSVELFG